MGTIGSRVISYLSGSGAASDRDNRSPPGSLPPMPGVTQGEDFGAIPGLPPSSFLQSSVDEEDPNFGITNISLLNRIPPRFDDIEAMFGPDSDLTGAELKRVIRQKEDAITLANALGVDTSGSRKEILNRIADKELGLEGGERKGPRKGAGGGVKRFIPGTWQTCAKSSILRGAYIRF